MKGTLLEGNIRRELISLSIPLLIGSVLQQMYNTVDSLIISRFLGTEAFSAVGIAGTIMNLFIFVLTGFCTGISVILAQMYGSGDRAAFRREMFASLSLGAGITLALAALFMALMRPVLLLIQSPAALIPYIESYLRVIIGGMLCTYLYNLFSSMLRAIGDTRAATFFLFVAVAVNAVVDYLFVGLLNLGIAGAAWATVLSQLLSALCCLVYIMRRDRDLLCSRHEFHLDKRLVGRTLTFGFSSALHQSSLYIGKIFVQGAVNTLGTPGIAAYTATTRIEGFANSFGTSVGEAVSVFVSQNYGAQNDQRVKDGLKEGLKLGVCLGLVLSALMFLCARVGVGVFLAEGEAEAIGFGVTYLRQIALFYVLCFAGNPFAGYFRSVGRVYIPLIATTLHISVRVALSYLWAGELGLRAVALATGIGWLCLIAFQLTMLWRIQRRPRPAMD